MRDADGGCLPHGGVRDRGGLELGRPDPLAGDVERVVRAPVQEPEAVLVDGRPVAVDPDAGQPPPVRLEVALWVAPEAARHGGERLAADELAHVAGADERVALVVDDVHRHPERRPAERARLDRHRRHGREKTRGDLGTAGDVDQRHAAAADVLIEPAVRLGVPGLAGRHERAQRREIGARVAVRQQCAHERRRESERGDALLLDDPPEPVGRPVGRAFGEHDRRPERPGADERPRAHDPAHVRGEVHDVALPDVGLVADLARDRDEEAALHVDDALRHAGGAGRVREQVRRLGLDLERRQLAGPAVDELVPRRDDHVLDRGRLAPRLFEDREHRHLTPSA